MGYVDWNTHVCCVLGSSPGLSNLFNEKINEILERNKICVINLPQTGDLYYTTSQFFVGGISAAVIRIVGNFHVEIWALLCNEIGVT